MVQEQRKINLGCIYSDSDLINCQTCGKLIDPSYMSRKFKRFLRENNLKDIRFHDLRHSNATLMLKIGTPAKIASVRLGHRNIGITMDLYSHVLDDMQQETAEALNSRLYGC